MSKIKFCLFFFSHSPPLGSTWVGQLKPSTIFMCCCNSSLVLPHVQTKTTWSLHPNFVSWYVSINFKYKRNSKGILSSTCPPPKSKLLSESNFQFSLQLRHSSTHSALFAALSSTFLFLSMALNVDHRYLTLCWTSLSSSSSSLFYLLCSHYLHIFRLVSADFLSFLSSSRCSPPPLQVLSHLLPNLRYHLLFLNAISWKLLVKFAVAKWLENVFLWKYLLLLL